MDAGLSSALHRSQVIDLTTTGRRSGRRRRIEIFLHELDGRLFISGMPFPTKRHWLLNVEADPHVVVHLKQDVVADVPAIARVIEDETGRRPLIEAAARRWGRHDVDRMMELSPLMEITPLDP
jgi:deazaflavin-dependent oxidoreductase (nitroreductase family)